MRFAIGIEAATPRPCEAVGAIGSKRKRRSASSPRDRSRSIWSALTGRARAPCQRKETVVLERFLRRDGSDAPGRFTRRLEVASIARGALSLRKRFCRSFNVELQAAATEDAIVLSLGPTHSFPLEDVFQLPCIADNVRECAGPGDCSMLPCFKHAGAGTRPARLRILRFRGGKKVPPARSNEHAGRRPARVSASRTRWRVSRTSPGTARSPIIRWYSQTTEDCLHEAMDIEGHGSASFERLQAGELTAPRPETSRNLRLSPRRSLTQSRTRFSMTRRSRNVGRRPMMSRRWLDPDARRRTLARLDRSSAIDRVREAKHGRNLATPKRCTMPFFYINSVDRGTRRAERASGLDWFVGCWQAAGRATRILPPAMSARCGPLSERLPLLVTPPWPDGPLSEQSIAVPGAFPSSAELVPSKTPSREIVSAAVLQGSWTDHQHGRACRGAWSRHANLVDAALGALEGEGFVLRKAPSRPSRHARPNGANGVFSHGFTATPSTGSAKRSRPSPRRTTYGSCSGWQHAAPDARMQGPEGLAAIIEQLEGMEAGAAAWEVRCPAGSHGRLRPELARPALHVGPSHVESTNAAFRPRVEPDSHEPTCILTAIRSGNLALPLRRG